MPCFDPADVQDRAIEIHLIPPQVHCFGGPQPVPEREQDHGGVAVPVTVLPRRCHERLDLVLGQVFARAQVAVLRPPRHDCSFFGGWGDQPERCISHRNSPVHRPHCSENSHFANS